jgi:hypothetical protein
MTPSAARRLAAEPCPQICPELSNSDPLQPQLTALNCPYLLQLPCKWATRNEGVRGSSPGVGFRKAPKNKGFPEAERSAARALKANFRPPFGKKFAYKRWRCCVTYSPAVTSSRARFRRRRESTASIAKQSSGMFDLAYDATVCDMGESWRLSSLGRSLGSGRWRARSRCAWPPERRRPHRPRCGC